MKNDCEICGSINVLPFDLKCEGVDIVACNGCGLVWNRKMQEESAQLAFYQKQNRAAGPFSQRYLVSMLARAAGAVEFLGQNLQPGMRHLDVGCAEGTFLALTRALGLQVTGLEVDINHSRFAREVRQLEVLSATLEEASLDAGSYDFVSLVHVTEHLVYPTQVLTAARDLLRDEGLLYIEVPNLDQPLPGSRHFFRPKHNFYFTANTVRALVAKAGFTPVRLGYSARDTSVQLLARKNPGVSLAGAKLTAPWCDDARQIRDRVQREHARPHLLLKLLFSRVLRQRRFKRLALRRYGKLLPEISLMPDSG
jgi:2-polyprenyl-3-methyl-5-hydroxy-6-metoxy-1,4-benzoquinol methylase